MTQELPTDIPVSYQSERRKCGKRRCSVCAQGEGHGPYWYAYWIEGGMKRVAYLGKNLPESVKKTQAQRSEDVLLTFNEAAAYLKISRATLYRLKDAGKLSGQRVGARWRFWQSEVRACLVPEPVAKEGNVSHFDDDSTG